MQGVATEAFNAAEEFGVIDEKAERSLDSAKKIFGTLKEIDKSGFTLAGAAGLIGGVAGLVNSMMAGDNERKRLLKENNQRLEDVRDGLTEFRLEISGGDLAKLIDGLQVGLGDEPFTGSSQMPSLLQHLNYLGFSESRLDQIAKDLRINIRDSRERLMWEGLSDLLGALMGTNRGGRPGFGTDLTNLEDGFSVNQTSATDQIAQLGALGANNSDVLKGIIDPNDLQGSRERLRTLFNDFLAGKITNKQMGNLSRSQFQSFLTNLIGRIDSVLGSGTGTGTGTDSGVGGGSSASTGMGTGSLVTGGTSVPTATVQAVIKAMDTNIGDILTSHTAIHERIAVATEGSYTELQQINTKMDTLIAVSSGTDRVDVALEETRRALAVQQGVGVAF